MSDISIAYEFPFICNPFWCPQEGGNLDVLFRDLFHASQNYSAFTTHFLFLLTHLQTQMCNEIMFHHLKHDLCIIIPIDLPPLTGVALHFYFFLQVSNLNCSSFQACQVKQQKTVVLGELFFFRALKSEGSLLQLSQ